LKTSDFQEIIRVEFRTTTYVVDQKYSLQYRQHLINKGNIYTESDQLGCFREKEGGYDALCFMSLRQRIKSVLTVYGVSVDVGAGFYRQLFAEVNTLVKLKKGSNKRVVCTPTVDARTIHPGKVAICDISLNLLHRFGLWSVH